MENISALGIYMVASFLMLLLALFLAKSIFKIEIIVKLLTLIAMKQGATKEEIESL